MPHVPVSGIGKLSTMKLKQLPQSWKLAVGQTGVMGFLSGCNCLPQSSLHTTWGEEVAMFSKEYQTRVPI